MTPQTESSNASRQRHERSARVKVSSQHSVCHRMYKVLICPSNKFVYLKNSMHLLEFFKNAWWMNLKRHIRIEPLILRGSQPLKHPHLFLSKDLTTELWVLGTDQDQKFEGEMRSRSLPYHMAGVQLAVGVWVCFNDMKQTNKQNMLYFGK